MFDFAEALKLIPKQTVLCVGDLMLDDFVYGEVTRISPEAPTPVLAVARSEVEIGGAGNVARNIAALGAHCLFVGLIGKDEAGRTLTDAFAKLKGSVVPHLVVEPGRHTTRKVRFVSEHHSAHLMRADWETAQPANLASAPNYPMIGDVDFNVSKLYGMLPASVSGDPAKRTAADNQTVRNVFVIGPDKKIKLVPVYPMSTGRNFDEVLRVIDSLQLTAKHRVSTPVNWKQGEDVILGGAITDEEAKKLYPQGWRAPKPYMRIVPQPKG